MPTIQEVIPGTRADWKRIDIISVINSLVNQGHAWKVIARKVNQIGIPFARGRKGNVTWSADRACKYYSRYHHLPVVAAAANDTSTPEVSNITMEASTMIQTPAANGQPTDKYAEYRTPAHEQVRAHYTVCKEVVLADPLASSLVAACDWGSLADWMSNNETCMLYRNGKKWSATATSFVIKGRRVRRIKQDVMDESGVHHVVVTRPGIVVTPLPAAPAANAILVEGCYNELSGVKAGFVRLSVVYEGPVVPGLADAFLTKATKIAGNL